MTFTICILITILVCLLVAIVWIYFDFKKCKRKKIFTISAFLIYSATLQAQYIDNNNCSISFKWYENSLGKLEYMQDDITYQFAPNCEQWKITIKNNSAEKLRVNWKNSGLIINGKASKIILYPLNANTSFIEEIESNSEISQQFTSSNLVNNQEGDKIYNNKDIKKGKKAMVTIMIPITIGNKPQFLRTFDFIISKAN